MRQTSWLPPTAPADRRRERRIVPRDASRSLVIQVPACLAAPVHWSAEESEFLLYLSARALDPYGAGRVPIEALCAELAGLWSPKQFKRLLTSKKSARYWEMDRGFLRLHGIASIVTSFPECFPSSKALYFPLSFLHSRQRRGAALLAPLVATADAPRSIAFVERFTGVNRKTVGVG